MMGPKYIKNITVEFASVKALFLFFLNNWRVIRTMRDDANKHNLGVTLGDNINPTLSHGIYLSRGGDIFGPAEEIAELERSLQKAKRELQVTQRALEVALEQSVTDPLTGLANRRGIELRFSAMVNAWKRSMRDVGEHRKAPNVVALMIDIDHFKSVNDRHGHTVGDQMLVLVSNLIGEYFSHRQGEILGRWGGEEFLIVLPQSSIQYAYDQASIFRDAIERTIIHLDDQRQQRLSVTVSVGIAETEVANLHLTSENIFADLVSRTDALLYVAKDQGRNRVLKEKKGIVS